MAVCCQGQSGEEWVIIVRYGKRLERSWEYSFYFECDLRLLVKATGVILLLGVGSLVCYKICNLYWPRTRPRPGPRPPRQHGTYVIRHQDADDQLLEGRDLDEGKFDDVEGRYFGPTSLPKDGEGPDISMTNADLSFQCSRSRSSSTYPNSSTSQSENGTSGEDEGRDADVSDGSQGEKSPNKHLSFQHHLSKRNVWSEDSPLHMRHHYVHKWQHRHKSLDVTHRVVNRQTLDNNSGWLINKISKILTSTPEKLQLPESAWLNFSKSSNKSLRLSRVEAKRLSSELGLDWREHLYLSGSRNIAPAHTAELECQGETYDDFNSISEAQLPSSTKLTRDESYDSLGFSKRLQRDGSFDSTCSEISIDFSLPESTADVDSSTMLRMEKLQQEIDRLKTNCLMMDEDFEIIKCNRNLPGMSSLMKANVSHSSLTSSTLEKEKLGQEQESLSIKHEKARACFAGLYSLTTIKNSTSSELSDSFPTPIQHGVGGQGSIGSAESLDWDSPKMVASPEKLNLDEFSEDPSDKKSKTLTSELPKLKDDFLTMKKHFLKTQMSNKSTIPPTPSEDELMASLEWDEESLTEYPENCTAINNDEKESGIFILIGAQESSLLSAVDTFEMDLETELGSMVGKLNHNLSEEPESIFDSTASCRSFTASPTTERSSKMESSSGFESGGKLADSCISMQSSQFASDSEMNLGMKKNLICWSSQESGCMEWDSTIGNAVASEDTEVSTNMSQKTNFTQQYWDETAQSSSNPSELSTPASENPPHLLEFKETDTPVLSNVGHKVNLFQYVFKEWQGNTKKAKTILQGYSEIPSLLGMQNLRKIRGDNYCGVRAAIFQTLAQSFPIPSGERTFQCLSHALNIEGCGWLQNWNFACRLPYQGNNVLHGMEVCLRKLDNVASLILSTNGDKEETLAALLNTDASLDLHMMEAVKLHMLLRAMELHRESTNGSNDVPLFAILMFARDTSETPKDFMNNHLQEVGNSGGLEQIEMFLLGYTLGVTIRVVRPASFGTEDFVCSYPDMNEGNWPQVYLIAEDDRHYNVLVK